MSGKPWATRLCGAVLCAMVSPLLAEDAAVLTLNGEEFVGAVDAITPDTVRIVTSEGPVEVATGSIHWLRLQGRAASMADEGLGRIELVSGSVLPATSLAVADGRFQAELAPPLSLGPTRRIEASFEQLASFVFHLATPELADQWRRIRQTEATADLIVVKRRDGQTLDFVEGIITAVSDAAVTIELDGEPVQVKRERVYGGVLFRPAAASVPDRLRVLFGGAELHGESARLVDGERLEVSLPIGETVTLPLAEVRALDYSRGGVQSLSDQQPIVDEWRPYFAPPGDVALLKEWGGARGDQAYDGGPLTIRGEDGRIVRFARGLAIRSHGEVSYAAPAGFNWLRATVGLDPAPRVRANIVLQVSVDGQEVLTRAITTGDAPYELEVPIAGAGAVTLEVDFGEGGDAGDNLHLGNARFTK
ncbi:NPCBM/NEW2 domain protein [Posidoniimonas polymericola]|uniref:NPCBM/NEW2 domain protein n=1 Tax=Posidoniimonas polymericola TaxID=2528002 RepID=A0A5C5YLV1_9BACT|nr:NPCBM/NEW2 domain-containing protein [Posidoniimonas polymericola]TWT75826.1 NPCBM/NEW2 domain protein [Posidoniimonas polymericola]